METFIIILIVAAVLFKATPKPDKKDGKKGK
jgi:hypothetical protein